jgi:hypothetical protein
MQRLRRAHAFGRFLAAWLLLWFVAMAAGPLPSSGGSLGGAVVASASPEGHEELPCAHSEEPATAAHDGHGAHDIAANDRHASDDGEALADSHAGHATGSSSHCPLCLHAAAPLQWPGAAVPATFATARPSCTGRSAPLRMRAGMAPPQRGPPALS